MPAWLLLLAPVLARAPTDLERAWYLAQSGRIEEARGQVVAQLEDHPDDIAAHRLYTWLMVRALRDGDGAEALYRAWVARDREAPEPRIALANALHWRHPEEGGWCEEAENLLQKPERDREVRYWRVRTLLEVRETCPGERAPLREELIALGERYTPARPYALRLRVEEGAVDQALAEDLSAFYAKSPWDMAYPGDLWRGAVGPALEVAQDAALEAARRAASSDEPMEVEAALDIFRRAGDEEARVAAEERLRALDPGHRRGAFVFGGSGSAVLPAGAEPDPLLVEIAGRCSVVSPEEALVLAAGYDARVPPEGPARAAYEGLRAELLAASGDPSASLEARLRAWRANSGDHEAANGFAWEAALSGEHLDEALEAIAGAAAALPAYDPHDAGTFDGYDGWLYESRFQAAAILDTHGWVLHALGRDEEAAARLRLSILLAPDDAPVQHLHLGLCYDALGNAEEALRELGRGLATLGGEERELELAARVRLAELYPGRAWAPRGMDDWIAAQAPAPEPATAPAAETHGRIGEPFEDLDLTVDGQQRRLSDLPGVRVVDLWATWCAPCKRAMPSIEQLARDWTERGVTVISVSVDSEPEDMEGFLAGRPDSPVVRAWAGQRALRQARARGIPSLFVLDGEGRVQLYLRGWGATPADRRKQAATLADALERVLGAE